MIGTKTRGFHHFLRVVKTLKEANFFFRPDIHSVYYGTALFVEHNKVENHYMRDNSDYVMMFNHIVSNVKFNPRYYAAVENGKAIIDLWEKYGNVWVVPMNKLKDGNDRNAYFSNKIIVPSNFERCYDEFCAANKKQLDNVLKHYDSKDNPMLKYLYALTNGSKNFFFWAANSIIKSKASILSIEKIMNWNDNYSQLSKNLKKGTITAYTNGNDFFALMREMSKLRTDKRANDVINMFNTAQKKILKAVELSSKDYETLSKFGKLSTKKKINFVKKMSTVEDSAEILRQMSFLADIHFEWKKESLIDAINNSENFNCEIVMDKGDIVLLKVNDYETVKRLAKTTNWCISKDKKYWNEYVENRPMTTQYVIFDFSRKEDDKLSIVGFTSVHNKGITNAHDFENKNLMNGNRTMGASEIKSFISGAFNCNSIYGILDKDSISISDVVTYEPSKYEWDKNSMLSYLNTCIDEDDYYIIYDDNNKLVIIVETDDIKYFLGDNYIDAVEDKKLSYNQHIIFADFSKKKTDPNRLIFGVINHNYKKHESTCSKLFNERYEPISQSFDSKLEEYNLPYDTICRNEDIVERFYNAYFNLEIALCNELIRDKDVVKSLERRERVDLIYSRINDITFNYNSGDYIDLFYNNGICLSKVIGENRVGKIASNILRRVNDLAGCEMAHMTHMIVPSENDINRFYEGNVGNERNALYIGYFLTLMKIIEKEVSKQVYAEVVTLIYKYHTTCDVFDLVMARICNNLDINASENIDLYKAVLTYAYSLDSKRLIAAIEQMRLKGEIAAIAKSLKNGKNSSKLSEYWVRRNNGVYALEQIHEEAIAHSPRKR